MNSDDRQDEEEQARWLEEAHDRLLRKGSLTDSALGTPPDEELVAAREILELIDRVKEHAWDKTLPLWGAHASTFADAPGEHQHEAESNGVPQLRAAWVEREWESSGSGKTSKLARFEIVEQLGQGGFGLVFRGYDPDLDREVAIKIPRPETLFSAGAQARFVREAKTAAALSHPHIVTIYESGKQGSIYFLVSKFIRGETLAEWLARRQAPLDPRAAAELVAVLADAVQHAHSRHVLHRDLKPSNILLESIEGAAPTPAQLAPSARIADFGLAKVQHEDAEKTDTGALIGTPAYMSPEQTLGSKGHVGPATDVYALGAILYELITGRKPFVASSVIETIQAVQRDEPTPPRAINPAVPKDLEAISLKCLEKAPASRYASAYELQADLQRLLDGQPVVARPVTRWRRLARWAQRNPALAATAAAAGLFFTASLLATTIGWIATSEALHGERLANEKAERRSRDLKAAFDDLFSAIEMAPEVRIPGAESLRQRLLRSVNDYYREASRDRPNDPVALAAYVATINRIASLKFYLKDYQGALVDARGAINLASRTVGSSAELQFGLLRSRLLVAQVLAALGRQEEFQSASHETLSFARSLRGQTEHQAVVELARAYSVLADAAMSYGDRTLANTLSRDALQLWETVEPAGLERETAREMLSAYFTSGTALGGSEKWEESRQVLEFSLNHAETLLANPDDAPPDFIVRVVNAHRNLGSVLKDDKQQSEPHFVRALELLTHLLERHPLISEYLVQIVRLNYSWALTEFIAGRYESANERLLTNLETVDELLKRHPGEEATLLLTKAHTLALLGYSHQNLRNLGEALDALRHARTVNEQLVAITNQALTSRLQLQGVVGGIAAIEGELGHHEVAIALLTESNRELRAILEADPDNGECSRFLAGNLGYLRTFHGESGQWDQALVACNESMQYTSDQPLALLKGQRAGIYLHLGDVESAERDFRDYCECSVGTNPRESTEMTRCAIALLESIDEVSEEIDRDKQSALTALRASAIQTAIARLNQMRDNPDVEDSHWSQLFSEEASDTQTAEIRQWRIANSK